MIISHCMPLITKIASQKSKKRLNVYVDKKFAFPLDLETFVKSNLKVGEEITKKEIERLKKKSSYATFLQKLLSFISLRPRSEKEIDTWLYKKRVDEKVKLKIKNRIKDYNLLDDKAFARWWIGQRFTFKKKSLLEIKSELKGKGIPEKIYNPVLKEFDFDEEKTATELLLQRQYKWGKLKEVEKKVKMTNFLLRKGFGYSIVREVVKNILNK